MTADMAKGFLAEDLPALSESDRAAVSWFVAELLTGMFELPVRKIGAVLTDTATAYSVATVDLLGWNGEQ
jgi:hypothetical protein